jgi:hypothetical protein
VLLWSLIPLLVMRLLVTLRATSVPGWMVP